MIRFFKQLRRRTPLGWLQLKRDKMRLLTAISGIAFADLLIFMQLGFQTALYDSNTQFHRSLDTDLVLLSTEARKLAYLLTFPRRRIYQAMDVPGVQSAEAVHVSFLDWRNPQTREKSPFLVVGQNPRKPAFNIPAINQHLDSIKLPDTVLFDRASRGNYQEIIAQVEKEQTVTTEIGRRTIRIAGLFQIGASFNTDGVLITSDQNFLRIFPNREPGSISMGLIELEPTADPDQTASALKAFLPDDVRVLTAEEFVDFEIAKIDHDSPIGLVFGMGSAMGFVVGVVIVYQVLSTDVNDHLAEYATFQAMGYSPLYLLGVVFEEALILSILGFMPALAVSAGLYSLTSSAAALPMAMTLARATQVLILTIVMCSLSGAIATRKLQAADPADIF